MSDKWEGRRKSSNMEDRRMGTTGKVAAGGGVLGLIFLLFQLFTGGDASQIAEQLQGQLLQSDGTSYTELSAEDKRLGDYCSRILASTEDVWREVFRQNGMQYRDPKMVLFRDNVRSACGGASSTSGPFYCPADETVYMDLSFFEILKTRFGAQGGDFAIAYVIAHEVGHHVQHQQGILRQVQQARRELPQAEGNRIHVAMELQADYYAGMWAHYERKTIDEQDIEEALSAAAAVGNDAIQMRTQGYVMNKETFTHGSSEQRVSWFTNGFRNGTMQAGNTFDRIDDL
jgi:uncharacterized protein